MFSTLSLTLVQKAAVTKYVDPSARVDTSQNKQNNSCAFVSFNLLAQPTIDSPCCDPQNQHGRHLYARLQVSAPSFATTVSHNTTAGTKPLASPKFGGMKIILPVRAATMHALSHISHAVSGSSIPVLVVSFLWLYFAGSLFFDIAHYLLHKFSKSRSWILRRIGYLHEVHHLYFNRRLKFNDRYLWQNMVCELPLELGCQLFGTWLGFVAARTMSLTGPGFLSPQLFHLVLVFEIVRSTVVAVLEGRDSNHQSYSTVVPKDPHTFLVGPEYHALHHVDPSAYISSSFRVLDWFLGTSYTLRSRRITMTGVTEPFGQAMKNELLSKESVKCLQELLIHDDAERWLEALGNTDVLIISGKEESSESVVKIIETFKKYYKPRPGSLLLPEVWYISNQNQQHSSSSAGSAFMSHARTYHDDKDILYRQIVLSKPTSYFGNAFLSQDFAAKAALWWIRRGARYIPVTDPASAIWGYFEFFYKL
jgi:hypothetical protein